MSGAWFFPANPGLIDQVATQPVTMTPGHVSIGLRPLAALHGAKSLSGLVVLRDSDGHERYLIVEAPIADGRARGGAPPSHAGLVAPAIAWSALPRLILFALLGGMILNLMPCVFPVLAMKALALSRLSGVERAKARLSAGFYTAGVLVAFALLGALMLVLREAGSTVGWGFQFQSALFVIAICWLLFLVGLNLSGLFEIGLGAIGFGQGLATRDGHAGDFATGLLAVVVASPCTAPFMGVAVAGALAANAAIGMAVFLSMGLGLALPYVLLASSPALAARLPRPGSWMVVLRQALSFPVFASCAWLAWVTAIEGGTYAVLVLASGMVCLAVAGWLLGLAQRWASKRAPAFVVAAGVFAAIALSLLPGLRGVHPAAGAAAPAATQGEPFSESRLALLRARGTPVFVDMTAAWCVTCLLNERVALSPKPVREAFARQHIALLVGDWTSRDSAIAAFLRAHGRDGVPLYVYYPAGAEGRVLPQILTRSIVLREIGGSP